MDVHAIIKILYKSQSNIENRKKVGFCESSDCSSDNDHDHHKEKKGKVVNCLMPI